MLHSLFVGTVRTVVRMDKLTHIQIESSTACNGRCVFCPRHEMTRKGGAMTDELFHKIVEQAIEMEVELISPFLNGEPFVFPRLFEWLDYLQERNVKVMLFTNALAFTKQKADKINTYSNISNLIFSVHGYDKRTYEAQMNIPYDKVVENIEYFTSIAKIPYQVYMLDTAVNHPGINIFLETWKNSTTFISKLVNWAGKRHSSMKGTKVPCPELLHDMTIYWDGRVCLCCMDSDAAVVLGDLNKQSLKDVWESNQWRRDEHKKLNFNLDLCLHCNKNII
jgi:uncharacterized Fe-S cluster-containing radical SAM superfamily enzyme